jgi:hypothetical protein
MIVLDFVKISRKREERKEENGEIHWHISSIASHLNRVWVSWSDKKEVKGNIDFVVSLFAYTKYV